MNRITKEPRNVVYGISKWNNSYRARLRHLDNGKGKPLCETDQKVFSWSQELGIVTCPKCENLDISMEPRKIDPQSRILCHDCKEHKSLYFDERGFTKCLECIRMTKCEVCGSTPCFSRSDIHKIIFEVDELSNGEPNWEMLVSEILMQGREQDFQKAWDNRPKKEIL